LHVQPPIAQAWFGPKRTQRSLGIVMASLLVVVIVSFILVIFGVTAFRNCANVSQSQQYQSSDDSDSERMKRMHHDELALKDTEIADKDAEIARLYRANSQR
jgi:hypothetical protein